MRDLRKVCTINNDVIMVDVSDKGCLKFGFRSQEVAMNPNGNEVTFIGVASSNEGSDVLWYEINHQKTKGRVCYWGGKEKNLLNAGFEKIEK